MFITFEEYQALGGTADNALFTRLELLNRLEVNKQTVNRLGELAELPANLKPLMFELIQLDEKQQTLSNSRRTASESNSGISVTYADSDNASVLAEKTNLIKLFLQDVKQADGKSIFYLGLKDVTFCG